MNVIDVVLGIILLFGLVRGLINGFFVELASLVALIFGIYSAVHFSYLLKNFLLRYLSWEEKYIQLLAFALTFLLVVLLVSLLGRLLTQVSGFVALGLVNKLLGGIFGFFKMAFLLSIVILFFENINRKDALIEPKKIEMSVLYEPIKSFVPILVPTLLKFARENEWLEEETDKLQVK